MKNIDADELKSMRDSGEDFVLVNVLSEQSFQETRIPGSLNIPVHKDDFEERFKQQVPDKSAKVVLYCASIKCRASEQAAERLENMGYESVFDYEGGIRDWMDKGFEVDIG